MRTMNALYWLIRVPLGTVIALAGIAKLADLPGFVSVIHTYRLSLPDPAAWTVAVLVSIFELGLGLWILSGYRLPTAAKLSMLMHAGYGSLLAVTLMRGIELENCGCFGVFHPRPLEWYTPLEDVAMVGVSFIVLKLAYEHNRHHGNN